MAKPKKEAKVKIKKIVEKPSIPKVSPKIVKQQRFFRIDRKKEMEEQGWKEVKNADEKTADLISKNNDLVLMEK